jgi:endonuclease YncB( thermonuclease family)
MQLTTQSRFDMQKTLRGLLILGFVLPGAAFAAFTGNVLSIASGDTLTVDVHGRVLKVRIRDIDAPEAGQPFGADALKSLAELCNDTTATLRNLGIDRERRVVSEVKCGDMNAGAEQVRRGMAWVYERSAPARSPLYDLQAWAKAHRNGLWSDAAPVPPWKWSDDLR